VVGLHDVARLVGADRQKDFLTLEGVGEAEIDSRRELLMVAMDGEARLMETPLRYRVRPGAIALIVP